MLMACTGYLYFLLSVSMQKIPRTTILISTPALAASYSLAINNSSLNEFNFRVMAAVFLALAALISLVISCVSCFLIVTGLTSTVLQAFKKRIRVFGCSK